MHVFIISCIVFIILAAILALFSFGYTVKGRITILFLATGLANIAYWGVVPWFGIGKTIVAMVIVLFLATVLLNRVGKSFLLEEEQGSEYISQFTSKDLMKERIVEEVDEANRATRLDLLEEKEIENTTDELKEENEWVSIPESTEQDRTWLYVDGKMEPSTIIHEQIEEKDTMEETMEPFLTSLERIHKEQMDDTLEEIQPEEKNFHYLDRLSKIRELDKPKDS